jgi:hypothetical protein
VSDDSDLWEVEFTDEFEAWWIELTPQQQDSIVAAVEILASGGPALGRPLVDRIENSRHQNMKELRIPRGNIRILFIFDPLRNAILLIGGDKSNRWAEFYREMIPLADDLYDEHLEALKREGQR